MGMFDDLTCLYPLPGTTETKFQTKSLDCGLDQYTIDKEGKLWVKRLNNETDEWDLDVFCEINGAIEIHGPCSDNGKWLSFTLGFDKGILFKIWDNNI